MNGQDASPGSITGTVSNASTMDFLKGATVSIPSLGLTATTDEIGFFTLRSVPAGEHELEVSYMGLDTLKQSVSVAPGARATLEFKLTTQVYQLNTFTVAGEREGNAAALTEQRQTVNIKHVATSDTYGTLPNLSFAELAIRLPGVSTGSSFADNVVTGLSVRGIAPELNSVTIDGAAIASNALTRAYEAHTINGAMFESVEVIKGLTPNLPADSIGGTINMKSQSPLNLREKRRITYSALGRWAPTFTEQVPLRRERPLSHSLNLGYQEIFDVFGGERNFGVYVNLFRNENVFGTNTVLKDYQNTGPGPAFVYDYSNEDAFNKRDQTNLNVKASFKLSDQTTISFNYINGFNLEPERRHQRWRAYTTSQAVGTTGTAPILPGSDDLITRVRATPNSIVESRSLTQSYHLYRQHYDLSVASKFDSLAIDYGAVYSKVRANGLAGETGSGILTMQVANVGWELDYTKSATEPVFRQTEGPSVTDPNNYLPITSGGMYRRNQKALEGIKEFHINADYKLGWTAETHLRAGLLYRDDQRKRLLDDRRWNYAATTKPLISDPAMVIAYNPGVPFFNPRFITASDLSDPTQWTEDVYGNRVGKLTATTALSEKNYSGFAMMNGQLGSTGALGKTSYIAGVRVEKMETEARGFVRSRTLTTAAQRAADPLGSANLDWNNPKTISGEYTKAFPSAHANYDFTRDLKGRVSYSTGYGKPPPASLYPSLSFDEVAQTVTVSNPGLLPQMTSNLDVVLEYYFKPMGNISVGYFRKTITDFIVSGVDNGIVGSGPDNGFDGQFAGFRRLTSANAGKAFVQGWEFTYQQNLTFLPGALKDLSVVANYTVMDTHGQFGALNLGSNEVAGFIPETGNFSISWRHRGFGARLIYNYIGEYLFTYAAGAPQRNVYVSPRHGFIVNLDYAVRPGVTLTLNLENLTNTPRDLYRGYSNRLSNRDLNYITITAGVTGRF